MLLKILAVCGLWLLIAMTLVLLLYRIQAAGITRKRLFDDERTPTLRPQGILEMSLLRRWLFLAGFRGENAPVMFLSITLGAISCGVATALLVNVSGLKQSFAAGVETIPGGVGQMFLPLALLMPWLLCVLLGMAPWLFVRTARRNRIVLVEQDLPLALELLATLCEAGLGFDAALSRILDTRLSGRPLATEFQTFQADVLAGRARVESLRRFSQRIQLSTVSIMVSALVQAEQVGMGISGVLRRQANDMRNHRREKANAFAASLPVKRMLPLVICFMPGLFVWTLGPFFLQLFKIADSFIQTRGL